MTVFYSFFLFLFLSLKIKTYFDYLFSRFGVINIISFVIAFFVCQTTTKKNKLKLESVSIQCRILFKIRSALRFYNMELEKGSSCTLCVTALAGWAFPKISSVYVSKPKMPQLYCTWVAA